METKICKKRFNTGKCNIMLSNDKKALFDQRIYIATKIKISDFMALYDC